MLVITSYSIHYTKLFDERSDRRVARGHYVASRFHNGERFGGVTEDRRRITSYNVCYTKLLRDGLQPPAEQHHVVEDEDRDVPPGRAGRRHEGEPKLRVRARHLSDGALECSRQDAQAIRNNFV